MSTPQVVNLDLYQEVTARIEDLEEDPDNIRLEHQPETVDGLTRALEHFGRFDVAPRVWRTEDGKLRALAGSGRVRAAKKARSRNKDLQEIPVIHLAPPSDRREKIFLQFAENGLRDVLGPIDYGRGFKMLHDEGLNYEQIVTELVSRGVLPKGRTKAWVSQMIQLTELQPEVQRMVNRGDVSVWHGLRLGRLSHEEQLAAAERIVRERLSRADLQLLLSEAQPAEAALTEAQALLQQKAEELSTAGERRRTGRSGREQRHGQVQTRWTLAPAAPPRAPRARVAGLQKLEWWTNATAEERELAVEAVAGGHSPGAAVDLVQRAVEEAPGTVGPLRELLILLGRISDQAEELHSARSQAPAEFARLRLRAVMKLLAI